MTEISSNNKLIAKNTLMLYFRMIVVMLVTLYTSRVVLATLGVEDYGIYNIVGGVVAIFSVMTSSLVEAIGRFLTFQLGRNDDRKLKEVFSTAVFVQIVLSIIVVVIGELIGYWVLSNYLVIPSERLSQAYWVYHLSIITFCINLLGVPYRASIISHERMTAFAYISIVEASLDLIAVFILVKGNADKLILYAFLKAVLALIIRMLYIFYCKNHFRECKISLIFKRDILKEMGGFAGWTFIGTSSEVLKMHGVNILLNVFFGPLVNAARGVSTQVNAAVSSFSSNIMTAVRPQIIKSYAQGDNKYMFKLVNISARVSFYLLLILSLPVIINTDVLLGIWLVKVPDHAVWFVRFYLILSLIDCLSTPLVSVATATGDVRNWQLVVGGIKILELPLCLVALKLGGIPEIVMVISVFVSHICLFARLALLHRMTGFNYLGYLKDVYMNVLLVAIIALILPLIVYNMSDDTLLAALMCMAVGVVSAMLSVFVIGCNRSEQRFLISKINTWVRRE